KSRRSAAERSVRERQRDRGSGVTAPECCAVQTVLAHADRRPRARRFAPSRAETRPKITMIYCTNPFYYKRRISREVMIGRVGVGGANSLRVKAMLMCVMMDTDASVR